MRLGEIFFGGGIGRAAKGQTVGPRGWEPANKVGFGIALGVVAVTIVLLLATVAGLVPRYTQRPAQLTDGPYVIVRGQDTVRMSGDMVLYSRAGKTMVNVNGTNLVEPAWDNGTYAYDIADRREYKVAPETLDASVSQNIVAWRDGNRIVIKNFFNGSETALPVKGARPVYRPEIEGDRLVWADHRNDQDPQDGLFQTDIYMYNFTTLTEARLTTQANASWKGQPYIRGDMVVWADAKNGSAIHAYYISNGTEVSLTSGDSNKYTPKASSRAVAWLDDRKDRGQGQLDLYCLDIQTMNETRVTAGRTVESFDIWGGRIVWSDTTRKEAPGNSGDIRVFDLAKNATSVYFASQWSQYSPAIWGDRIVWVDGSKAGGELFIMRKADTRFLGMDLMTLLFILSVAAIAGAALGVFRLMRLKDDEERDDYERKAQQRKRGKGPRPS